MEITIRRVLMEDAPVLADIAAKTFYDTFTGTCSEADMERFLKDYFNLQQVEKELSNSDDFYFFADIDGQPAGYCRIMEDYKNFDFMKQWKALELKRLYVLSEFHGKGIAQKLMEFIIDFAKQHAYEVVWLGVWEHNLRAKKFYQKSGFEYSGHRHDFPIGDTPQTDEWYWRFI